MVKPQGPFFLHLRPLEELVGTLNYLRRTQLWFQILIGMVLGILVGLALEPGRGWVSETFAQTAATWLALPGQLFLALIQSVVLALVVASIVTGLNASGDVRSLRRIGTIVVPFFLITTVLACVIGVGLAFVIEPGSYIDREHVSTVLAAGGSIEAVDPSPKRALPDVIVSLIPQNFVEAAFQQNMLQIVVMAMLLGAALLALPKERAKPLLDVMQSIQAVAMKVVAWAMTLAPIAVFGLLAQITIQIGVGALLSMSAYVGTVLAGLLLLLLLYLASVVLLARVNPIRFLARIREVMLLAFSTSSSAAVMPLSIRTVEDHLDVRPAIAQLVIPLGATVNMAGTALYQVVAAVFLTQVFSIELTTGALVVLIATTVGASIGSPASPGVGIVILATLLAGIGVPPQGIALVIGVDRILDMLRTAINVTGDLAACVIAERFLTEEEQPAQAIA